MPIFAHEPLPPSRMEYSELPAFRTWQARRARREVLRCESWHANKATSSPSLITASLSNAHQ
eukprot:7211087-Pyramimonas_sp.AAC.1